MELEDERREYRYGHLTRDSLAVSPFTQFDQWMTDALAAGVQDPTAMCVATVGADGRPSQRIVLLKHFDSDGFVFYTNLESRKARDISSNDRISLHFAWLEIDRQLHIEGRAEKLKLTSVLKYFVSRPRDSQLAAWSSQQSRRLSSRQVLDDEFRTMQRKFSNREIPLPSFWGGYRVIPDFWEFWQGRENRLHDRFQYSPASGDGNAWDISRVAP
jgi:pyridoxamine 5'-phosphate oxidase